MTKEKILITGGAGYVGSVLTGHLLREGYQVTCLDDLRYGQRSLLTYVHDKYFNFVFGDTRDEKLLAKEISKVDAIVPLAAIVGMPACNRNPYDAASINRDAVMLVNKLRTSSQRLAFPNTNSGYGAQSGEFYCTEETPLEPISLYGKTKVEAEKHLLQSDKPAIVLRLATVFGFSQRMRLDLLVNDFVHQAMTTGCIGLFEKDFVRNYIHIGDIARVFQHCIENFDSMRNEENQVYNVGLDDANLSKGELALKIKEHLPKTELFEIDGEDPDKRNYIVSNKKIADAGFKPIFSLDNGIEELIKGYEIMQKTDPNRNA